MTLTSFLDVKADPPKPDETKVDLLRNLSNETALVANVHGQQRTLDLDPLQTVEYVELYNHRLARRRRLCRALAWFLALFLLLDIGVVLYIGLRMRHHQQSGAGATDGAASTVTCRLRFRGGAGAGSPQRSELAERIIASGSSVLMQPMWAADGRPTVLHDVRRGFTLLRAPAARLCFIKHAAWRRDGWSEAVAKWAEESHDVLPENTRRVRLVALYPGLGPSQLRSYGSDAWSLCHRYSTYRVEVVSSSPAVECPMRKCVPCPGGVYLQDAMGCQTCRCGDPEAAAAVLASSQEVDEEETHRSKRHAVAGSKRTLTLDEGVLPGPDGRPEHTIDVIEF